MIVLLNGLSRSGKDTVAGKFVTHGFRHEKISNKWTRLPVSTRVHRVTTNIPLLSGGSCSSGTSVSRLHGTLAYDHVIYNKTLSQVYTDIDRYCDGIHRLVASTQIQVNQRRGHVSLPFVIVCYRRVRVSVTLST